MALSDIMTVFPPVSRQSSFQVKPSRGVSVTLRVSPKLWLADEPHEYSATFCLKCRRDDWNGMEQLLRQIVPYLYLH